MTEATAPAATPPATITPETTDTQQTDAAPEPEPWRKAKHKYKANGEEHEVEYDELVKRAEKAHGAEKRLAEATAKEKSIQAKLEKITGGDWEEFVALTGGDEEKARGLAERFVWDKIKYDELSDEKKEALAEKKRADTATAELDALKQKDIAAAKTQAEVQAIEIVNKEVSDAIAEAEKAGLSPEDVPAMIEALVDNMVVHLEYLEDCESKGIKPEKSPLSPRDVLRTIQTKQEKTVAARLKGMSAKELRGLLTPEQLSELRQSEIEALYAPSSTSNAKREAKKKEEKDAPTNPFADPKNPRKKPSTRDWFGAMEQHYKGK